MSKMRFAIWDFPPLISHALCVILGVIIAVIWVPQKDSDLVLSKSLSDGVLLKIRRKGLVVSRFKPGDRLALIAEGKCMIPKVVLRVLYSSPLVVQISSSDVKPFAAAWSQYRNLKLSLDFFPDCKVRQRVVYR